MTAVFYDTGWEHAITIEECVTEARKESGKYEEGKERAYFFNKGRIPSRYCHTSSPTISASIPDPPYKKGA